MATHNPSPKIAALALAAAGTIGCASTHPVEVIDYALLSKPKLEAQHQEMQALNQQLGTHYDSWKEVLNGSIGVEVKNPLGSVVDVSIFAEYSRGEIGGVEQVALGTVDFSQKKEYLGGGIGVYANLVKRPSLQVFIGGSGGVGQLSSTTDLRITGYLQETASANFLDTAPFARVAAGLEFKVAGPFWALADAGYSWMKLEDTVIVQDSLRGQYPQLSVVDSTGLNARLALVYRFPQKKPDKRK